ncbi:MAG: coiled-coil domain-containing protein [Promethearchaeati archaeon]
MEISIGNKKIPLKEQYNLIVGDFEEKDLRKYKKNFIFKELEDLNLNPFKKLLKYFKRIDITTKKFEKLNKIIEYLDVYRRVSAENVCLINNYVEILDSLFNHMQYNLALKRKDSLSNELKLSKIKEKSNLLSTKTNLLKNLNNQVKKNRKELEYLKEDYFEIKNKRKQIHDRINNLNEKIKKLKKERKEKFSEINRITRDMEHPENKKKLPDLSELSNAEKIKNLRSDAKDIHYKSRQIESKLNEAKNKLYEIQPKFKSYKKDFGALKSTIQRQENQIKQQQDEIKDLLEHKIKESTPQYDMNEFNNIRDYEQIKKELNQTEREINTIKNNNISGENMQDLEPFDQKLSQFYEKLIDNKKNLTFNIDKNKILNSVERLRDFELILKNFENISNKFLININLEMKLVLITDFDSKKFFIQTAFIRNEKDSLKFEDLTTPEKVFVVMVFFFSINIGLDIKQIIFSNLFLHENFNKRGSLFRTIRKILPILNHEKIFSDIKVQFLISNLELKRPIENLNIIKI